jgi:hypothetical protein
VAQELEHVTEVRYIKLGRNGIWWAEAFRRGVILHGGRVNEHKLVLAGRWAELERVVRDRSATKYANRSKMTARAQGTAALREYREIHGDQAGRVWVTFEDGHLWWAIARTGAKLTGRDGPGQPKALLQTIDGWHNTDLHDRHLACQNCPVGRHERQASGPRFASRVMRTRSFAPSKASRVARRWR